MSREMAEVVAKEIGMSHRAENLLLRNIKSLTREERRLFFEEIKPLEKKIKALLTDYCREDREPRDDIIKKTVDSLLEKKGDPDLVDSMVMDVFGRLVIYQSLRERADSEGIKLSAMTSFGGLSMVLFAVVIITAIILYIKNM